MEGLGYLAIAGLCPSPSEAPNAGHRSHNRRRAAAGCPAEPFRSDRGRRRPSERNAPLPTRIAVRAAKIAFTARGRRGPLGRTPWSRRAPATRIVPRGPLEIVRQGRLRAPTARGPRPPGRPGRRRFVAHAARGCRRPSGLTSVPGGGQSLPSVTPGLPGRNSEGRRVDQVFIGCASTRRTSP